MIIIINVIIGSAILIGSCFAGLYILRLSRKNLDESGDLLAAVRRYHDEEKQRLR